MSACEDREMGHTLQSDVTRITECITVSFSSEWSEFRQVYSSLQFIISTSHDQFSWLIKYIELKCLTTDSNALQFRQIYSSFYLQSIHSQIPHENTHGMLHYLTEVTSNRASLFIILSSIHSLSNTTRKHQQNASLPNRSDFKQGKSIHHSTSSHSLFNSNDA